MTKNIKSAIEQSNLTIKELSELLEIPYKTLMHWKVGDRTPPPWAEKLVVEKIRSLSKIKIWR